MISEKNRQEKAKKISELLIFHHDIIFHHMILFKIDHMRTFDIISDHMISYDLIWSQNTTTCPALYILIMAL